MQVESLCDLSNGAISSYLERHLTPASRQHSTLNISVTAQDRDII